VAQLTAMRIGGTCCTGGKERHKPMTIIYEVVQKNGKNVSFLAYFLPVV
jgi:hypothetical protein